MFMFFPAIQQLERRNKSNQKMAKYTIRDGPENHTQYSTASFEYLCTTRVVKNTSNLGGGGGQRDLLDDMPRVSSRRGQIYDTPGVQPNKKPRQHTCISAWPWSQRGRGANAPAPMSAELLSVRQSIYSSSATAHVNTPYEQK